MTRPLTLFLKLVLPFSLGMEIFLIMSSCNKDDSPGTDYRISRMNYYDQNDLMITSDILYEDLRVTSILNHYFIQGQEGYTKLEINYPQPDSIIKTKMYEDFGIWKTESREIIEILNGFASSAYYTYPGNNGQWIDNRKFEFQYNGNNLSEVLQYEHGELHSRTNYEYNATGLVQSLIYSYSDGWSLSGQDTLFYNGDELDSLISYQISNALKKKDSKKVYFLDNGIPVKIDIYEFDSTSWHLKERDYFTYDSRGNITSKTREISGRPYKYEFIYEKGTGNYQQVNAPSDYFWDFYLVPEPVKSYHSSLRENQIFTNEYSLFQ